MKKKIYLTVLTLVTVLCIIFGSIYHLAPIARDGFLSMLPIFSNSESQNAGSLKNSESIPLDAFSKIDINTDVASITICTGDDYSICYQANEKLIPTYKVQNNVLKVTQEFHFKNVFNNSKCRITITVPAQTSLDAVDITNNVGDIIINDIISEKLTTDSNVGDQSIEQCDISRIKMDSSVGDTDIKNCSFSFIDIDGDVGDVCIRSNHDLSQFEIDLDTSVGDVSVNRNDYKHNYTQKGNEGSIRVDNSTGDISLIY